MNFFIYIALFAQIAFGIAVERRDTLGEWQNFETFEKKFRKFRSFLRFFFNENFFRGVSFGL